MHTQLENCRNCSENYFVEIIDLGNICPSDFVSDEQIPEAAPLRLVRCVACDLVQLADTVDLDQMYRQYWYKSGLNAGMVKSLQNVVDSVSAQVELKNQDVVIDIGCNDGTMLEMYPDYVLRVGFDPALNLAQESKDRGVHLYADYFSADAYSLPKAKLITAIAMFYDLPDPNKFLQDINSVLLDDGLFVVQFTDLLSMLRLNAFDNICHEHLEYYSFEVLKNMFYNNGLIIYHVETNDVNGGSVRVYAKKAGYVPPIQESVEKYEQEEREYMESFDDPYQAFADRVSQIGLQVGRFFRESAKAGHKVYAMGASTKGNTLLQYFGINNMLMPYAAEVSQDKFGKKTVATNIEIIPESDAIAMEPDYFFVLPWHFIDGILEKSTAALDQGIKFVTPMPEFAVYYKTSEGKIAKVTYDGYL